MSLAPSFLAETKTSPVSTTTGSLVPDPARRTGAPAWFQRRSSAAWEEFQSMPLPGLKDEAWRYSSAKRLGLETLHVSAEPSDSEKKEAVARSVGLSKTATKFVFVNDGLVRAEGNDARKDFVCLPFAEALKSHGDVLEQYLMKRQAQLGSEKFAALHLAHVRAGAVILVPKNLVVADPIEIFHWVSGADSVVFPHTLIVTGDQAQITVIDHHLSLRDESAVSIGVADFVAGPGSRITYVCAQELSPSSRALNISSTVVGRDASVKALQLHLGASFSRSESVSDLTGEGARSEMLGVSLPFGEQFVDMRTLQNHVAPRTFSDLLYKNALYDRSKTVFAGLIQVEEGAHYTDAYQKCRNLLNSDEAEASSMPGLEINADQVKCSHGATSAPISADELFYLKARGIPDVESRRLIATGFIEDTISRLENENLIADLDRRIEEKFARLS